ncbi:XkdW family protein [Paenibacillus aquistagni]|uniref:XkdW family protein n=1 Tax=Paenibacillus aquistagni TaxID=1852522 RepID=UPI00145BA016|nr:XkdW family protein [Paenibacillus aquistagni]NMM52162.1 hypothetical protein [Paenibacillus aquistagni]
MNYYAQLVDGIVVGISSLSGIVESDDMIKLDDYRPDLVGYRYENGEFIYVEPPIPEPEPPSQVDILGQEITQMKIKDMQQQAIIDGLGRELTNAKIEIMQLKGGQTV